MAEIAEEHLMRPLPPERVVLILGLALKGARKRSKRKGKGKGGKCK